ncbi:hypothetical protein B4065_3458 [Caldibacillus thermoamylovorans]|uniref:hypothetical protein n=1 Tax=Caldibacillus thermoamylovorans TaxID=35841 RepID=UPI0005A468E6|nr:hypothetical protein [Caldibacillus thermoamylovorans]KIO60969.1 hypothetical protein B4065_3458 [Caldibacillus thermoamylovorans]
MLKKWGIILLVLGLIMAGCSAKTEQKAGSEEKTEISDGEKVTKALEEFLEQYQNKSYEEAEKLLENDSIDLEYIGTTKNASDEIREALDKYMLKFDFKVKEPKVNNNEAIVSIEFKNFDLKKLMNEISDEITKSGKESNSELYVTKINEKAESLEKVSKIVDIKLINNDSKWHIILGNELKNVLTGNLFSYYHTSLITEEEMNEMKEKIEIATTQLNTLFEDIKTSHGYLAKIIGNENVSPNEVLDAQSKMAENLKDIKEEINNINLTEFDDSQAVRNINNYINFILLKSDGYFLGYGLLLYDYGNSGKLDTEKIDTLISLVNDINEYKGEFVELTNEYLKHIQNISSTKSSVEENDNTKADLEPEQKPEPEKDVSGNPISKLSKPIKAENPIVNLAKSIKAENPITNISEKDAQEKVEKKAEADHPDNKSTQEYLIKEQLNAYKELKELKIDTNVKQKILNKAIEDHPYNFSTIKYLYKEQLDAYEELKELVIDTNIKEKVLNKAIEDHPYNFSTIKYLYKEQLDAYEELKELKIDTDEKQKVLNKAIEDHPYNFSTIKYLYKESGF